MTGLEKMFDLNETIWIASAIAAFSFGLWLYTRLSIKVSRKPPQFNICDGCGENIVAPPAQLCSECKSRKSVAP